jgi:hypothetical protein
MILGDKKMSPSISDRGQSKLTNFQRTAVTEERTAVTEERTAVTDERNAVIDLADQSG